MENDRRAVNTLHLTPEAERHIMRLRELRDVMDDLNAEAARSGKDGCVDDPTRDRRHAVMNAAREARLSLMSALAVGQRGRRDDGSSLLTTNDYYWPA